ncbi:MAG: hypothetical protein ABSB96_01225 [Gaiellaceae bacterium]
MKDETELDPDQAEAYAEAWRRHVETLPPRVQRLIFENEFREFASQKTGVPKAELDAVALISQHGFRRARRVAEMVLSVSLSKEDAEVLQWIDKYRSTLPRWRRIIGL